MNCPVCLSVMYCNSEIHDLGFDKKRMDLHCNNKDCAIRGIMYHTHMGVITHLDDKWLCYNYHLPFNRHGRWFALEGNYGRTKVTILQELLATLDYFIPYDLNIIHHSGVSYTFKVLKNIDKKPLIDVPFISLSTDNDMHEHAKKTFDRLINLVSFT
ncbi:hypothetical protein UFOVP1290_126 [uncultured Caudovirales phage]|uniref:Uncharacterized protein n=1 Tax=uncultured Caudovirales phage TaxID=2100421 RepID=A0A6J5RQP4_9CAUD|nr:hypothetical protein UFOVP1290_126 [uncultured Caudovirales phage]